MYPDGIEDTCKYTYYIFMKGIQRKLTVNIGRGSTLYVYWCHALFRVGWLKSLAHG